MAFYRFIFLYIFDRLIIEAKVRIKKIVSIKIEVPLFSIEAFLASSSLSARAKLQ